MAKVLVVDDDLLVRRILSDLFAGEGLEVTAVDRAERALILARTERSAAPIEDVGRALAAALRPPVSAAR